MSTERRRLHADDYSVGWICALYIELAAAKAMLDEEHAPIQNQSKADTNVYTLGSIGSHNIAIVCLPAGQMGTTSAAIVAIHMAHTFPNIRYRFMVGIGGGVPSSNADIRLGDVVISEPSPKRAGGVIQHDFGKALVDGGFEHTGFLNGPPPSLLSALNVFKSNRYQDERCRIAMRIKTLAYHGRFAIAFGQRGPDILFKADFKHLDPLSLDCSICEQFGGAIERNPRPTGQTIMVHYGTIASGNQVIKDAITRDKISARFGGILCYEMEAAGIMNHFQSLVIRGISDYADSHKNKGWQPYAAATAAACAKEIILLLPLTTPPHLQVLNTVAPATSQSLAGSNRRYLIVGVNYGAAFSSISYTNCNADAHDISIIKTWPGMPPNYVTKVPSCVAYAAENRVLNDDSWGYEVEAGMISYTGTKQLLERDSLVIRDHDIKVHHGNGELGSGVGRIPKGKTPETVVSDFLKHLYRHSISYLGKTIGSQAVMAQVPIEFWLTTPNNWSNKAKISILNAAKMAGFGSRPSDCINSIPEQEAAIIWSLQVGKIGQVRPVDGILICSCDELGIATITAYNIIQTKPILRIRESCASIVTRCGSPDTINQNLYKLMSKRFGQNFTNLPQKKVSSGSEFMRQFDSIKRDFYGIGNRNRPYNLTLIMRDVEDSDYYDEDDSQVRLTERDVRNLFDPVITELTELLNQQIQQVKETYGNPIKYLVLAGCFAELPYLCDTLKRWSNYQSISFCCPDRAESAAVLGAALHGLKLNEAASKQR